MANLVQRWVVDLLGTEEYEVGCSSFHSRSAHARNDIVVWVHLIVSFTCELAVD